VLVAYWFNIVQMITPMTLEMHFPEMSTPLSVYIFKDKRSQYRIRKRNVQYELRSIHMLNQITTRRTYLPLFSILFPQTVNAE